MKLIILDRDGVINHDSDDFVKSPDEWLAIDGSLDAISRLTHAEYRTVIASNQSGLGREVFSIDDLNRVHEKMLREIALHGGMVDAVFFCPHSPSDDCNCRKPNPGLFEQISSRVGIPLDNVPYVGDKECDVEVARHVGARPYLVKTGYGQQYIEQGNIPDDVTICENLYEAVDILLNESA
ncbi:MAG: D-glycero-beta-D-manno-heptose 1,7-bisphosphate 7-phosphatase [Thiotrichales bacterium]|nr:D-glycero-beta-D-manno-heptose 1,7-bisphosphate 7-phosphatase [Thiotrichales bacterium]